MNMAFPRCVMEVYTKKTHTSRIFFRKLLKSIQRIIFTTYILIIMRHFLVGETNWYFTCKIKKENTILFIYCFNVIISYRSFNLEDIWFFMYFIWKIGIQFPSVGIHVGSPRNVSFWFPNMKVFWFGWNAFHFSQLLICSWLCV